MEESYVQERAAWSPAKKDFMLMLFAVLCGVLFDYLFYGKMAGVSFPIAVILFYALFFWGLRDKIVFTFSFAWLLMLPIVLLSSTYVIYSNEVFQGLNLIAILILIAVQTLLITRNHTYPWYTVRFIREVLQQIFPRSLRHFPVPYRMLTTRFQMKVKNRQYKRLTKVLLGLLISAPILGVVITLLASADKVFAEIVSKIPNLLDGVHLGETFFRFLLIIFVATYVFSYIWSMLHPRQDTGLKAGDKPSEHRLSLDSTIALTLLTVINFVYILFTVIQFTYLFGSGDTFLPDGITYAEHARSGFGELVVVTIINFSILLTVIQFVRKEHPFIQRVIQIMLSLLISSTLVMLCSSYIRLLGYEQAYGYTYTRVLVHAFLIFLFVLFLLALYRIWREHTSLFKQYLIVAMIAYVGINYINIDKMIAIQNIERYAQTGKIDIAYLSSLSYDVVPELIKLNEQETKPEGLDGRLERIKENLNKDQPWQSFNLSKYRVREWLKKE
jgi:hypothetical protein